LGDAIHLAGGLAPDALTADTQVFRYAPDGQLTIFSVSLRHCQQLAADPTPYHQWRTLIMKCFDGKRILIVGGTGSLGQTLVRRFLSGHAGDPQKIIVFSRDEANNT